MQQDHKRWGWGPVCGAYAPSGGHVKVFGFTHAWVNGPPYSKWEIDLFSLVAFERTLFRGEYENRWALGRLELKFHRARYRYYEVKQARERRAARRRLRLSTR